MILVTGGTGLVGSHLLYFLLKKGEKVRAIHRKNSDLHIVEKVCNYYQGDYASIATQLEWFEANITDIPILTEAFEGVTHVYHAAAYVDFNPKNYHKLKKANIEGTANVVNLCLEKKVEKLCYVSSIATLGNAIGNEVLTEETYWNPEAKNSVYAITKYGAEMEVWRGTQEGLQAVIVNPGVILGEGLWHKGSGSIVTRVSKGLNYYTSGGIGLVDVRDVVRAMLLLMESATTNERFILVAANKSYRYFLTALATHLGTQAPTKNIARWKLSVFSGIDWFFSTLFGTKRKLLRTHVNSLYTFDTYDGSKIEEVLSFSYTPLSETLLRLTENFRSDTT
ncbi:MAG TPA: NAD-dependent epimerase [Flavobacteriaceae bacterium]|nr:NAD-dependent epimerase [Flavobacteriaceae bacterium]MAY54090.1 NAD-dependent epimerase [Flavobacteriaceae bacterium]HBR55748.1 NAD-dependent epimerase [Flavobacteriaceae bacterium]|tara:strand:- start:130 stop:1140 length:1011 start_codon:yes stop_codon:yes gene_type:complete